jgi:hypothetical protein
MRNITNKVIWSINYFIVVLKISCIRNVYGNFQTVKKMFTVGWNGQNCKTFSVLFRNVLSLRVAHTLKQGFWIRSH